MDEHPDARGADPQTVGGFSDAHPVHADNSTAYATIVQQYRLRRRNHCLRWRLRHSSSLVSMTVVHRAQRSPRKHADDQAASWPRTLVRAPFNRVHCALHQESR